MYNNEEKTINLIDLCFYMLKRWKQMVIAAVILAVVAAGFTYLQSKKAYEAYKVTVDMPAVEAVESVELTVEEKAALQAKIDVIEENEENIAEYDYYLQKSIKAKLNPNGFYEGTVGYVLSSDSNEDSIKALALCYEHVLAEKNYETLAGQLTDEPDEALLKEVVTANEEHYVADLSTDAVAKYEVNTMFTVEVQHYTQEDCEKMLTFFKTELENMQQVFEEENLEVSFEKVTSHVKTRNDRSLVTLSRDIKNAKSTAYDTIANLKNNMTDVQKKYYALSQGLKVEESGAAEVETPTVAAVPEPSVDLKMVVIAAIAGAFCVAGVYGVLYLFSGHVHNKEELESWLNLPVLEANETIEMVATLLAGIAGQKEAKKLYLTGSLSSGNTDGMLKLKELLATEGIEVVAGSSILTDAKALQDAAECGFAAFMEKCNVSKEKDIREEIDKATSCGVEVIGIILEK